jgi:predicted GNAT superfamily acetyltransferase
MAATTLDGIQIRQLTSFAEMDEVVALQRQIWNDPTTVIYQHMLISLVRSGGLLMGAFKGNHLIGFVLSYLGIESPEADRPAMANLKMVSQRMAVLPEYRGGGVGYALKLAQRDYAVKQGIRLITWTFDPLNSRNAHLNIRKLGVTVQHYERNYYGTKPSPLVSLDQSDRLVADWRVTNARVEQRLHGRRGQLRLEQYLSADTVKIINPSSAGPDNLPRPGVPQPTIGLLALAEIPSNFDAILHADNGLAREWRLHSREVLNHAFHSNYIITDFLHVEHEGRERSFYVFSAAEALASFSSN